MDFEMPSEGNPRRGTVRAWLEAHPSPTGRELAEAGYVAPRRPPPWRIDPDALHQLTIDGELGRAGVRLPMNPIGIGWAGPTILHVGTPAQRDRYLMPLLAGEELWCSRIRSVRWTRPASRCVR